MNYLLDKKLKKKKFLKYTLFVVFCFILIYFRSGIFNGFSYMSHTVFRPVLIFGNNIGEKFGGLSSFFTSKNSLLEENQDLKSELSESKARMSNYNSVLAENIYLKEILGRKNETANMILAAILSKPNQSLYDTLIIDAGTNQGLKIGDIVFAKGFVPIGRLHTIYANSSKVILFSNSGEKTQVVISPGPQLDENLLSTPVGEEKEYRVDRSIFMEIIGRGGGNFEMTMPENLNLIKGSEAVLPGINPRVLALVEAIISDPRDPFVKALFVSPVNVQELKFVQVEIK